MGGLFIGAAVWVCVTVPNEIIVGAAGITLSGGSAFSDWTRQSKKLSIITPSALLMATGASIWLLRKNHIPETVLPSFIAHHSSVPLIGLTTIALGLYAKTVWKYRSEAASIVAAGGLTLSAAIGTVDGIANQIGNKQLNPFAAGGKAFVDTAHVSAVVTRWSIDDLAKNKPIGAIATYSSYIMAFPAEITAFVGGFVGDVGTTTLRFVYHYTFGAAGHFVAEKMGWTDTQKPDVTKENVTVANHVSPTALLPTVVQPQISTSNIVSSPDRQSPNTSAIPVDSAEASSLTMPTSDDVSQHDQSVSMEDDNLVVRHPFSWTQSWVAESQTNVTFYPYVHSQRYEVSQDPVSEVVKVPAKIFPYSQAIVVWCDIGHCEVEVSAERTTLQRSGDVYGIITKQDADNLINKGLARDFGPVSSSRPEQRDKTPSNSVDNLNGPNG